VLFLRGDQTPGELKQRTERMAPMSIEQLNDVLTRLIDKGMVSELARQPGQKEERFRHRFSEDLDPSDIPEGVDAAPAAAAAVVPPAPRRDERMDKLEGEVASLRQELSTLRAEFAALREELGA
jgi:uncharacterized protein YceH (UPF0502 family)